LIAAEIERKDIPTVSISLLREITKIIKPPRALFVPYDLGYPLGKPDAPELQTKIIKVSLMLLSRENTPFIEEFNP